VRDLHEKEGELAMKLRSVTKVTVSAIALLTGVASAGCSRDHIEAVNLANEGDQSIKVNVEGAIEKYEQALQLDPSNHRIIWKLATAYEKKEDWDKMASTLSRAVQVAPDYANYWFKRGYALIKQAEAGNPDAYEEAKEPLKKCIERDPNLAECYHFLGQAFLWTDDVQNALDNYTKAVEHDPSVPFFYPDLVSTYLTLKFYDEAEKVLHAGTSAIQPGTEKSNDALYNMNLMLFQVAQSKGDKNAMVAAVEKAQTYAGEKHPEIAFHVGSTYAVLDPPQKEKAVRLLNSFSKRACKGAQAAKFKEQCETSSSLIQRLGGGT
jgi:tetratricopeptide (TPR) repeat protein